MYCTESMFFKGQGHPAAIQKRSKIISGPQPGLPGDEQKRPLKLEQLKNRFCRRGLSGGTEVSSPGPGKWDHKYIYIYIDIQEFIFSQISDFCNLL